MKFNDYYKKSKAEDKKNGIKPNIISLVLPCDCPNRKYAHGIGCTRLITIDMGDGEFEIAGTFLKKKSVNKLVNYLLGTGKPIIK